jgi:hypothetical protein
MACVVTIYLTILMSIVVFCSSYVLKEMGIEHKCTPAQAKKRWETFVAKYKVNLYSKYFEHLILNFFVQDSFVIL